MYIRRVNGARIDGTYSAERARTVGNRNMSRMTIRGQCDYFRGIKLTRVRHSDLVGILGSKVNLVLPALEDGGREPLLELERHHVCPTNTMGPDRVEAGDRRTTEYLFTNDKTRRRAQHLGRP